MKKYNIGVLGCARIAKKSVIPAILKLDSIFNLVGIASRDKSKSDEWAKEFGCDSYVGYESILTANKLDAVYIPLPNQLHAEWVERALNNGINVLVEKSLACSFQEVLDLNLLAESKGLALVENFQFRFHNQLEVIMKLIADDQVGDLRCVRSSFGFPPFSDKENIRYDKKLGGGVLLDAGAYPLKLAQIILGPDLEIAAASMFFDKKIGVDIWGGAFLKQRKGPLFAEIAYGFDNFYQCNVEIWGSKGKIYTNRIFTAGPDIQPKIYLETDQHQKVVDLPTDNHFVNMLSHFHKIIGVKDKLKMEYDQNIQQARLLNKIKELSYE